MYYQDNNPGPVELPFWLDEIQPEALGKLNPPFLNYGLMDQRKEISNCTGSTLFYSDSNGPA